MTDAVLAMNAAKQLPGANKGGRPDKIKQWHVDRAQEYVDGAWQGPNIVIPTAEGMAMYLDISRKTLYEASELSDTLEQVQRLQASMVLNGALANEYNPSIAKLILSAKHGYIERTEVANTHAITSQPSEAIASDFSAYVKNKTEAIPGEIVPADPK